MVYESKFPIGKASKRALIPAIGNKMNGRAISAAPSKDLPFPARITRNHMPSITAEPNKAHPFNLNANGSSTTTEELQYAKKSDAQ